VVVVHIAAAIGMSYLQKENLIKSMVIGTKQGSMDQAIRYPMSAVGIVLALGWLYFFYLIVTGALPVLTQ